MKQLFKPLAFLGFAWLVVQSVQAQTEKFGKISEEDLKMTQYDKDTSAAAVILFDVGRTYIEYNQSIDDFVVIYERHTRIKILKKIAYDKTGLDLASNEIYYYKYGTEEEKLFGLKGYTHSLENGKMVKYKMEDKDVFDEKIDDTDRKRNFTLPNVKEGSVIEYTYKLQSPYLTTLRSWRFQSFIPTIWSEYTTEIPEYFQYKNYFKGYEPLAVNEKNSKSGTITFNTTQRRTGWGGTVTGSNTQTSNINYIIYTTHLIVKDAPAINSERYITTPRDYLTAIEYQLDRVQFPNSPAQNIFNSWESVAKRLSEHERFGRQLKARGDLKDVALAVTANRTSPEEKIVALYQYVQKSMEWDGVYGFITSQTIKKSHEAKKGNIADIHLLLVALLREVGLEANPVLASTRGHGKINKYIPLINYFNYVLVHVSLNDQNILLDVTEPTLHPALLPFPVLNGEGLILSEDKYKWINLHSKSGVTEVTSIILKPNEKGVLSGDMQIVYKDYSANSIRRGILREERNEKKFVEKSWKKEESIFSIQEFKFHDLDNVTKDVKTDYKIELNNEAGADIIYLDAFLVKFYEENPFKQEQRKYPVDFGYPIYYNYSCSIAIPEGYSMDDAPKNVSLVSPDKSATFSFVIGQAGNIIQIRSRIKIDKTFFLPEEYPILREIFTQVIAKQSEQIVLKKVKK